MGVVWSVVGQGAFGECAHGNRPDKKHIKPWDGLMCFLSDRLP